MRYFIALAIAACSLHANAVEQYQLDVTITRANKIIHATHTMTAGAPAEEDFRGGRAYLSVTCEKVGSIIKQRFGSEMILSGIKVAHEIHNGTVFMKIEEHEVEPKDREIEKANGKCINLRPQVTVFEDTVEFDYTKNYPFRAVLKNGKEVEVKVVSVNI